MPYRDLYGTKFSDMEACRAILESHFEAEMEPRGGFLTRRGRYYSLKHPPERIRLLSNYHPR